MSSKIIIGTASLSGNYGSVPKQEIIDSNNKMIQAEQNAKKAESAKLIKKSILGKKYYH